MESKLEKKRKKNNANEMHKKYREKNPIKKKRVSYNLYDSTKKTETRYLSS